MNRSIRILALLLFPLLLALASLWTVQARSETASVGGNRAAEESSAGQPPVAAEAADPNCRYGIASWGDTLPWLSTFGAGWHLNFSARSEDAPSSDFVRVIRVQQDQNGDQYLPSYTVRPPMENGALEAIVQSNPGSTWFVGNEVDVPVVQDDTFPDVYARAYHEVYHYIKAADPTAQVGPAGLSMATPGRLQYWDIVWETYLDKYGTPLPADVWNTHLYILAEKRMADGGYGDGKIALGTDPALAKWDSLWGDPALCPREDVYCRAEHDDLSIFIDQMTGLREWMKDHGYQDVPLLLSEWGILYPYIWDGNSWFLTDEEGNPFPPSRVNAYMAETIQWMETATDPALGYPHDNYRLVQQWLWFSMWVPAEDSGGSSNLLKDNYATNYSPGALAALSEVGLAYRDELQSRPTYYNLLATEARPAILETSSSATVTATLTAEFRNNGNVSITTPFSVTFYSNSAMTNPIGTATVTPEVQGCARYLYTASVSWSDLAPGLHRYWARVDDSGAGAGVIAESSETDNVVSGLVFVDGTPLYLPAIRRAVP